MENEVQRVGVWGDCEQGAVYLCLSVVNLYFVNGMTCRCVQRWGQLFFYWTHFYSCLIWSFCSGPSCSRWGCWNPSSITMHPTSYFPFSMVRIAATDCHVWRLNSTLSVAFMVHSFKTLSLYSVLAGVLSLRGHTLLGRLTCKLINATTGGSTGAAGARRRHWTWLRGHPRRWGLSESKAQGVRPKKRKHPRWHMENTWS